MISLYAITRDYDTIIFPIIFPIMSEYTRFCFEYLRLFRGVGTRKMGMCRPQLLTQSRRNDWLVSMKYACSSSSTGRRADRIESCLMECSCTITRIIFLLYALFVLAEQDCRLCKYVLRTAILCTPILCVTRSL